jgi:hypothetical protein
VIIKVCSFVCVHLTHLRIRIEIFVMMMYCVVLRFEAGLSLQLVPMDRFNT